MIKAFEEYLHSDHLGTKIAAFVVMGSIGILTVLILR